MGSQSRIATEKEIFFSMQNQRITSIESRQHRERSVFFFWLCSEITFEGGENWRKKEGQESGCLSEGIQKGDNWVYTYI